MKLVNISLTDEQRKLLKEISEKTDVSVAALVRRAINNYLDEYFKEGETDDKRTDHY